MIKCRLFVPHISALTHFHLIMGCNSIAGRWATEKQKMAIDQLASMINATDLDALSLCKIINIALEVVEAPPKDDPGDAIEALPAISVSVSD